MISVPAPAAVRRIVVLAALAALAACSSTKGTGPGVVTTVTVAPSGFQLALAATQQLSATVKDQNGKVITGTGITWSSDDTTIATVSATGLVTAKAYGSTVIVAHAGSVTGSANVTVGLYHIEVRYLTSISPARQAAFDAAAAHWARVIVGDVPNAFFQDTATSCTPAMNETIDDIVIFVKLGPIDGPGKILGQSGPCFIRTVGKLPLIGIMQFDIADTATLDANGQFGTVILHEMGHVLGFGTIWDSSSFGLGLLADPVANGGTDPHFIGARALTVFDSIGGTSYSGGAKVPVERNGGAGTRDSHWRDSVFVTELMTGFLNSGVPNPLSVVTIASMEDEGYSVDYGAAEAYSHTFTAPPFAGAGVSVLSLGNDVRQAPIYVVDERGRVVGVFKK
jgi:hypothetical protein